MATRKNAITKSDYGIPFFAENDAVALIDPLLTVRETARLLRCSVSSLNKWRLTGDGPRFVYVGSRVRYRPSDIAAYVANQTRVSTSAQGPPQAA